MKYRATCPRCATVFRAAPDQLDAAQGWVQCGLCGALFDARAGLRLEDGSPLPTAPAPGEDTVPPEPSVAAPAPAPLEVQEEDAADGEASAAALEDAPRAEMPIGIAQREAASDLTSIIIIDPDIPVPDDFGPMPEIGPAAAGMPLMYPPASSPASASAPAAPTWAAGGEPAESAASVPDSDATLWAPPPVRQRGNGWAWGGASMLLLAVLLAQGAYFLRDTLVSHLPQTRPALERMCALLGCTLSLPKNLDLLQIVGSSLETESRGRLRLTLTLGNRAAYAQAWPVLVLTLSDQRNRPLARRSFAPSEYLADSARIAEGVPPRSEQQLNLPLAVHDLKAFGFDLQLVY